VTQTQETAVSRAVVVDEQGSPHLRELPAASPAPGEVAVRVDLAGVNFWEVMQRHGRVPLPEHRIPGSEGVGVVQELGDGVTGLAVGDRVAWSKVPGSYADRVVAPAVALVPVPDEVDDAAAASVLFQGLTAHYLCHDLWRVPRGETAVVTAAAGGVGLLLTQLLVSQGVTVISALSSASKAGLAIAAGASRVVTYGDDLAEEVRSAAPGGVAAVFDAVGAGVAEPLLATLRPRGIMVLYGSASGREAAISAADLTSASLYLTRAAGRDYLGGVDEVRERSRALVELVAGGVLRPASTLYPLADASRAWDDLESRSTVGKLLLDARAR